MTKFEHVQVEIMLYFGAGHSIYKKLCQITMYRNSVSFTIYSF